MEKRLTHNVASVTMIALFIGATGVLAEELNQTLKYRSNHPDNECVYGEAICGIAWEGKGLFEIKNQWLQLAPGNFLIPVKKGKVDLRTAYLCCNGDNNRLRICSDTADRDWSEGFFTGWGDAKDVNIRQACRAWVGTFASIPEWRGVVAQMGAQKVQACMNAADNSARSLVIPKNEALFSAAEPGMLIVPVTITGMPYRLGTLFIDGLKFDVDTATELGPVFDELMSQKGEDIVNGSENVPSGQNAGEWNSREAGALKTRLKYHLKNHVFSSLNGQKLTDQVLDVIYDHIDEQFNDYAWAKIVDKYQLIGNPDYELPDTELYPILQLIDEKTSPMFSNENYEVRVEYGARDRAKLRSTHWEGNLLWDEGVYECVGAIFDTLRDDQRGCLWNNPNGEFCDTAAN